jgi:predicted nucleic acid-binding protein
MDLVVDANVLFSALIKSGKTEDLMFEPSLHLYAPGFLFDEFEKYKELITKKTKREEKDFDKVVDIFRKRITTVANEEAEKFIKKAKKISPDKKDADYFALALKLKCSIWSDDKKLKNQDVINVYSTSELLEIYLHNLAHEKMVHNIGIQYERNRAKLRSGEQSVVVKFLLSVPMTERSEFKTYFPIRCILISSPQFI